MADRKKLLVIGNGMAGIRCVEEILKLGSPGAFEIEVLGAEPHPNYNRIMLSKVLAGDGSLGDIVLNSYEWYKENGITLHGGCEATQIDTRSRRVTATGGLSLGYDELILATGSLPFILPLPGANKEGVIAFRDIKD